MESKPSREEVEKLMAKLAESQVLFARISSLLGELGAEKGGTLDEVEERVVKNIREAGREVLKGEGSERASAAPSGGRAARRKKRVRCLTTLARLPQLELVFGYFRPIK